MVTVKVRNAFNSANWTAIRQALQSKNIPPYLQALLRNYFVGRTLHYNTDEGVVSRTISADVPQGSVLGPTLWNVMYDNLLRLPLDGLRADIIGFAEDLAFTFFGKTTEQVSALAMANLKRIERWLQGVGSELAHEKAVW